VYQSRDSESESQLFVRDYVNRKIKVTNEFRRCSGSTMSMVTIRIDIPFNTFSKLFFEGIPQTFGN